MNRLAERIDATGIVRVADVLAMKKEGLVAGDQPLASIMDAPNPAAALFAALRQTRR